jgi:CubicO group peptidase (beta-lactamase class C family)
LREDPLTARRDVEDRSWGYGLAVGTDGARRWGGGFGSSFWISPAPDLAVIVLTQRMRDSSDLPAVHREMRDAAIRSCS